MSEFWLRFIPTVPEYVPDETAREAALALLKAYMGGARGVTAEVYGHVEFVTAMGNFERVSCPVCGAMLSVDWWVGAMDAAYSRERGFAHLGVAVPCCGAATSLNDLIYDGPQGFARFVLSAFEPPVTHLSDDQMRELENIVGCPLRAICAHV